MRKVLFSFIIILLSIVFIPTMVNAKTKSLYDILKDEAEKGTLAKKYEGNHRDSFSEEPTKEIYHWYAEDMSSAEQILEKNNVIFANQCWQLIRTTDTGGVKIIYNGEVEDNKCLSTRENHVGYTSRINKNLSSNFWYGTDYEFDKNTKTFSISGSVEEAIWNETTGANLIGKYTCALSEKNGTCTTLYLVESYNNATNAYVLQLNSNSHYSQFGNLQFNANYQSPTFVGYMYGDVYNYSSTKLVKSQNVTTTQTIFSSTSFTNDFLYSKEIVKEGNTYSLLNPVLGSELETESFVGYYTFRNETTVSGTQPYYVIGLNSGNNYYYLRLTSSKSLDDFNLIIGDSLTDNLDGTYTISNYDSIRPSEWFTNFSNYQNKYTCGDASNSSCTNPRYITSTTNAKYTYINAGEKILIAKERTKLSLNNTQLVRKDELIINPENYSEYKYTCNNTSNVCTETSLRMITGYTPTGYSYVENRYWGSSVTWDGTNYTLVDPIGIENYANLDNISTHHYTCLSTGSHVCQTVVYTFFYSPSNPMFYITLKNGVLTIAEALENMFTKNTTSSTIKSGIDAWYKKNMLDYDEYIDDTIFCNNRSIRQLGSWNANGGKTNDPHLYFGDSISQSDLKCQNETDMFSISNPKAKLTYKVGLLTKPEENLLNNYMLRRTGKEYFTLSPSHYHCKVGNDCWAINNYMAAYGSSTDYYDVRYSYGVRPALSLKSSAKSLYGDGSKENPYIADFTPYYGVDIEIKNETKDIDIYIDDYTTVREEEIVKFKITPIKGYKITSIKVKDSNGNNIDYIKTKNTNEYQFTMPASDVTIIPSYEKVKNNVEIEDNLGTKEITISVNNTNTVIYQDTVKFTIIPQEGYVLEKIIIKDEDDNEIEYFNTNKNNEYQFIMPDKSVVIIPVYRKEERNIENPKTNTHIMIPLVTIITVMLTICRILRNKINRKSFKR